MTAWCRPFLSLWLLLAAGGAMAEQPDWDQLRQAPTALAALEIAASWSGLDPGQAIQLAQEKARLHAEAGETASALAVYPFGPGVNTPSASEAPLEALGARFKCKPVLQVLQSLVVDSRFVFINEVHHVPQTRALTFLLLRELRAQGFTHFALEGLREPGTTFTTRGYPTRASGTCLREPVFGELQREALRLGYRIVEYEFEGGGDTEAREAAQNLAYWRHPQRVLVENDVRLPSLEATASIGGDLLWSAPRPVRADTKRVDGRCDRSPLVRSGASTHR